MNITSLLASLLLLGFTFACASSSPKNPSSTKPQPPSDALAVKIDAVGDASTVNHLASLSIGVWRRGQDPYLNAYGFKNLSPKTKASTDTIYQIGSLTKTFTAIGIMQQVEQRKLKLSDPINTMLPPKYQSPLWQNITTEQLLSHTSGIPSFTNMPSFDTQAAMSHDTFMERVKDAPLKFQPGTSFDYSNSNFYLLGLLLEHISQTSYADYLQSQIFQKAGMTQSSFCPQKQSPKEASGYKQTPQGLSPTQRHHMTLPFAAGAICSTAQDLVAWAQAMENNTLLSKASWESMRTPKTTSKGSPIPYGLGTFHGSNLGVDWVGHGGAINGFRTIATFYPDQGLFVVLLTNTEGININTTERKLLSVLLDKPLPTHTHQPLSAKEADAFTGVFTFADGSETQTIRFANGALTMETNSGSLLPLVYQGNRSFFAKDRPSIEIEFTPSTDTKSPQMILKQAGLVLVHTRTKETPPEATTLKPVALSPEQSKLYLGDYTAPIGTMSLTLTKGTFSLQLTGQAPLEVIHTGNHTFSPKLMPKVRVVFAPPKENSPSSSMTLYQGGAEILFKRTKSP